MSNLYYVHQVGPNLVSLTPVGHRPDQGLPGGGNYPSQGLPVYPDQGLPPSMGGGRPDNTLPGGRFPGRPVDPGFGVPGVGGGRPDNTLPGGGQPGIPDHELPSHPPPQVAPGYTLVLVRQEGKWHYAVIAPGSPPPRPLPPSEGRPDNTLPGGGMPPPQVGGGPIMPPGQPPRPDQGLPPTAQPKR
jgi:hypothetical protein